MNVTYNVSLSPSVAEAYLAPTGIADSQFYIKKEDGFVTLATEYSDRLDFSSEIYSVSKTASKYKLSTNTVDVLATNIVVDDIPYFYKLHFLGQAVDHRTVVLNSSIDCIEVGGSLYTNEVVVNQEVASGLYVHSVPVINDSNKTVKYRSKDIEITYPASLGALSFKCRSDTVISPTLINNGKVFLPSFYIKNGNDILKCIEGDIRLLTKKEVIYSVGNYIQCKDLIHEAPNSFYNAASNKIYLETYFYESKPRLVKYTAKVSSHIFSIPDKIYFKVLSKGLALSSKDDYDFCISKQTDNNKIKIICSDYLSTYKSVLNPSDFVITNSISNDENENVSFKKQVEANLSKFPSEKVYIEYKNRYILQHNNSVLIDNTGLVEDDTYTDIIRQVNVQADSYSDYKFAKINGTYYYKNSDTYFTPFLYEGDEEDLFLLEDALLFIMEF